MAGKGLDPIFAQGSPPGRSAVAVIRISGRLPDSFYNELNIKKKIIEVKTGVKINVVAISAKNIKKKRKFKFNKKIFQDLLF